MAMGNNYKGVLFDLDNTLLDYDASELASMRHSLVQHGLNPDEPSFWEPFWSRFGSYNYTYWMERFERQLPIRDVLRLSFRDTFDELGHSGDPKSLGDCYWEHFCGLFLPEDGAESAIRRLQAGYRLAIVSNGVGEAQHSRLMAGGLREYFEAVVVSDEAGVGKPDPRIFQMALVSIGLKPEEVLFIGDSLRDDYGGAVAAGIDFCYYNRKKLPLPAEAKPDYKIEHLRELEILLK